MGDDYSHAHAACLAAQLPKGARCLVAEDSRSSWSDEMWMLWRIERNTNLSRWGVVRYDGEEAPGSLPYPGQKVDQLRSRLRFEANKRAVDEAFGMNGGEDEH